VIFSLAPALTGGSALTAGMARKHRRPCLHLSRAAFAADPTQAAGALHAFVAANSVTDLNIAGPRASTEPEVASWVAAVLEAAFPLPA